MRNFLYNKSDILIAVIIIAVAAVIIGSRVDAIMGADEGDREIPTTTADEPDVPDVPPTTDAAVETPPAEGTSTAEGETPPEEDAETEAPADGEPVEFTIEVGSVSGTVASDLESAGLVESAQDFIDELNAQGLETKIQAGTFEIMPGTSVADIVKKLTNS